MVHADRGTATVTTTRDTVVIHDTAPALGR